MKTYAVEESIKKKIDNLNLPSCLVVDDDMSVYNIAANLDFKVQPCTHYGLMSSAGQQRFQRSRGHLGPDGGRKGGAQGGKGGRRGKGGR